MNLPALVLGLVAPGAAVTAWPRRGSAASRVGTALALSPVLGGVAVALLRAAGLPWARAYLVAILIGAIVALLGRGRRRRNEAHAPEASAAPGDGAGPRAAWIAAVLGATALGLMYGLSEWWRLDSDAWTHAPIVRSLLVHGVPPLDPWYAGFHLQYAWLYHAWIAAMEAACGPDAFTLMSLLAVVSFAAFALVAGDFLWRLHGRRAGAALAFVLLGMNGALVLTLPLVWLQAMVGKTAGPEYVARAFAGAGADFDRTEALLRWFGTQTWFGNKFAGATPLSLGLAALVAWMAAFERRLAARDENRGSATVLALCAGAAAVTHPVLLLYVGATSAFVLVAGALGAAGRGDEARVAVLRAALPSLAGAAPAAVYYAVLLAPSASHLAPPLDVSVAKLVGLVLTTLPALVFAAPVLRTWLTGEPHRRAWAWWCVGALLFALLLRLPGTWPFFSVDKTSYLLWIPFALAGGVAWADLLARRPAWRRVALVLLALVPATALSLSARALDPRARFRQPWDSRALTALRTALPADALLVVPPGDIDTPIFLARDAFDEDKVDGFVRGYDAAELSARHALVDTLYRAGRLDPALLSRLQASGRPVYAVWPDQDAPWQARTPGLPQRLFHARGSVPSWAGSLPVTPVPGYGAVTRLAGAAP